MWQVPRERAYLWRPVKPDNLPDLPLSAGMARNKQVQLWKCEHGHEWYESIDAIKRRTACPKCSSMNTSQAEQYLFRHVKQVFDSTQNRADLFYRGKHIEADVYVPDIKFAIEYDGYHHSTRCQKDEEQNYLLNKLGIQLIRVRIIGLPEFEHSHAIVFNHDIHDGHSLQRCLCGIGDYIKGHFPITSDQATTIEGWSMADVLFPQVRFEVLQH